MISHTDFSTLGTSNLRKLFSLLKKILSSVMLRSVATFLNRCSDSFLLQERGRVVIHLILIV